MKSLSGWLCAASALILVFSAALLNGCSGLVTANEPTAHAAIQVNPTSVNFGSATVGKKISQNVSVANTGTMSVNINQASVSNSQFSVSGLAMPFSLPAGQSSSFQVSFSPNSSGSVTGILTVATDTGISSEQVALSGTATQAPQQISVNPTSLSLGTVTVGSTGKGTTTISNLGGSNLTISLISVTAGPFGVSGIATPATIAPGASATLNTTYTPTVAGTDSGSITITSNDPQAPTSIITLSGIGTTAPVAPTITTQPANQTVTAGQTAAFTVTATGTAPLSYQWQKNGVNIAGATSASYTTPATATSDSGSTFAVVVTNAAGTATSSAATLTVNAAPVAPAITTQPVNQTVTAGQTATFAVAATGTAPLSYQWQKNAANIAGATSASYTTPATTTADSGSTFRAVVTNTAGTATSSAATLTVSNVTDTTPPTVSITAPANGATVSGTVSVTATASDNVGVASVQFQLDGANLGALDTASPYSVSWNTATASNASHQLTAIAKDAAGNSATSTVVTVTVSNVADTTPPSVPAGLSATAISSSQINLAWTASTDNVGVTGYNIFRGGVKIGTAPSTSFQDGGLSASTSYTYTVSAFDAAGNTSAQSTGASATTQASSGSGIPSGLGWFQIPNTSIQSLCPPYPEIQGNSGCKAVMSAWSGGLFDTKRNQLIIHGGGHTDYYGNEIYAIDLNANPIAPVLVKDASHGSGISNVTSCPEAYTDGTPSARHSYNGEVYVANQDTYFTFSGSKSNCGFFSSGAWKYTPSTSAWAQQNTSGAAPNPGQNGSVPTIVYDPTSGNVFEVETNAGVFWKYDPVAVAWTNLANVHACAALNMTAAIDDGRRFYYCIGNGVFSKVSLNSPYTATQLTGSGCSSLVSSAGPGFAYDPVQKLMVGWAGGNTVYLYDPTTDSCSTATYTGGPTVVQANGTYGRFAYAPALGVFVVANSIDTNAYSLRLTQSGGTGGSGPVISGVSVGSITTTAAIVSWTTDVTATSQVEYGTTTAYGTLTTLDVNLLTSHVTPLAGLTVNTLYHYRVHSKNSGGVETISGDFVFQTSSVVDTIPPTVSITAPVGGATVSGTTTVSANATDNVGVASVQFTLDGSNLGSALTAAPYQISWDTTTTSNASHSISAVASDAAGNVGNATPVSVTVSNSGGSALQDFQTRCATPGVIVCEGFDNASEFTPGVSPFTGVFPGNDGTIEIVQDTSIVASGGGSLHFPIKASDGHAPTVRDDNWVQTFCSAHPPASCSPTVFAQNSTFYVQFRYRVDAGYANTNWEDPANGASSPKIADFANHTSSCGQTEITTNNRNGTDKPMMYTSCGARGFFVTPGTTNYNPSSPPYSWENGYYNCSYPTVPSGPGGCFTMPPNVWMTFYYRIQLGTWSQPNSHITAWVAVDGQPLQTFVDVSDMTINADTPGFDCIYFNVYMTNFAGTATNPAANAWLDEVIVSSAPVPAPAANGGGIPQ